MFKVALFEIKKMVRDYRLLIVLVLQPIILTFLLGNTAAHYPKDIDVSLFNQTKNPISQSVVDGIKQIPEMKVSEFGSEAQAADKVRDNKSKLAVVVSLGSDGAKNEINFITNATVPEISSTARLLIVNKIYDSAESKDFTVTTENNTKKDINFFSFYASAIMILILVLIGLNASVTAITQERIDGTFERFFVTPYSKASMVFGKMISYIGISFILTVTIIFSMKLLFDVALGPLWLVGLLTFANGMAAISLGLLISSLTYSIAESIQVGTLVFFSLLILTGLIFQPETMQPAITKLFHIIPFTYAMIGMREVNILGFGFDKVYPDILILFGSAILFLFIAVLALRRKAR